MYAATKWHGDLLILPVAELEARNKVPGQYLPKLAVYPNLDAAANDTDFIIQQQQLQINQLAFDSMMTAQRVALLEDQLERMKVALHGVAGDVAELNRRKATVDRIREKKQSFGPTIHGMRVTPIKPMVITEDGSPAEPIEAIQQAEDIEAKVEAEIRQKDAEVFAAIQQARANRSGKAHSRNQKFLGSGDDDEAAAAATAS